MSETTGTFSADKAIHEVKADSLGYSHFSETIATIIDNATTREDCLVLAIHGEWGSGKTSAINLIVDHLKQKQSYLPKQISKYELFSPFSSFTPDWMPKTIKQRTEIVEFKPWLFSNQENLTTAFFHELDKQLDSTWKNAKTFINVIAALTLPSLDTLSFLNPAISGIIGNTTGLLIKNLNEKPSLEITREKLKNTLKTQKRPLLIIIDDIDRLPADEIRQIFRLVKSVADLPYVTYLLAFDAEIIRRALLTEIDPRDTAQTEHRSLWMEKIVQGSFNLPSILDARLERYFWQQLEDKLPALYKVIDKNSLSKTEFCDFFEELVFPSLTTPREVNRLINSLTFQWIAVSNVTCPFDLIFIETSRLFNTPLYDFIRKNKEDLCHRRTNTLKLMKEKFPNINMSSFEKFLINISPSRQFLKSHLGKRRFHRLFSSKSFDNYFLYDQNPLSYPENKMSLIDEYLKEDKIDEIASLMAKDIDEELEDGSPINEILIKIWQDENDYDHKEQLNIIEILVMRSSISYLRNPELLLYKH